MMAREKKTNITVNNKMTAVTFTEDYEAFIAWLMAQDDLQVLEKPALEGYADWLGAEHTDHHFLTDLLGHRSINNGQDYLRAFWLVGPGSVAQSVGDLLNAVRTHSLLPMDHA